MVGLADITVLSFVSTWFAISTEWSILLFLCRIRYICCTCFWRSDNAILRCRVSDSLVACSALTLWSYVTKALFTMSASLSKEISTAMSGGRIYTIVVGSFIQRWCRIDSDMVGRLKRLFMKRWSWDPIADVSEYVFVEPHKFLTLCRDNLGEYFLGCLFNWPCLMLVLEPRLQTYFSGKRFSLLQK